MSVESITLIVMLFTILSFKLGMPVDFKGAYQYNDFEKAAMNYAANTYHYCQDSNLLYYFGLGHVGFAGVIDVDNNKDIIVGNDIYMVDIIWMGFLPSVKEQPAGCPFFIAKISVAVAYKP